MREIRAKNSSKERMEPTARSDAERIVRLKRALRSVAEIVDAALREDHCSEYLAQQMVKHLAEHATEQEIEPRHVASGTG